MVLQKRQITSSCLNHKNVCCLGKTLIFKNPTMPISFPTLQEGRLFHFHYSLKMRLCGHVANTAQIFPGQRNTGGICLSELLRIQGSDSPACLPISDKNITMLTLFRQPANFRDMVLNQIEFGLSDIDWMSLVKLLCEIGWLGTNEWSPYKNRWASSPVFSEYRNLIEHNEIPWA